MKHNKQELDAIIDGATSRIRDEQIDESAIDRSAAQVWARISRQAADNFPQTLHLENINTMNANDNAEQISGCGDFQSLIPVYLRGELSAARTLLLEDHTNECIPCRRELKAQRGDAAKAPFTVAARQPARAKQPVAAAW